MKKECPQCKGIREVEAWSHTHSYFITCPTCKGTGKINEQRKKR